MGNRFSIKSYNCLPYGGLRNPLEVWSSDKKDEDGYEQYDRRAVIEEGLREGDCEQLRKKMKEKEAHYN